MKKLLLIFGILVFASSFAICEEVEKVNLDIRNYNAIEIPEGTFIPVMNAQEISTQYCSEGYKVKFIVTNDLYMHDTNIIPQESAIYGYIEKINDPVVGTNAAMKIRVSKLVYPDGVEVPIKGYLYNANNNVFGGGLSAPTKYIKMAQRQVKVHYTTLQIKPSQGRRMGEHTTIPAGSNEIVVLTAPAEITHTLTN
jgi:hypothetical protein